MRLFRFAAVAVTVVLACLVLQGCTGVFFQPMKVHVRTPQAVNLYYEDVSFLAQDSTTLHAWFLPAVSPAKGTVFFLHGNAENISTHLSSVYWLPEAGFNVFLWDYRGFGKSQGTASLSLTIGDAEFALLTLIKRTDIDPKKIFIFGQSLGGALAIYMVANTQYRENIKAVIIDSAFSGYQTIAQEKLAEFWLTWPFQWPLSQLVNNQYDPIHVVQRITPIPTLFVSSEADYVIPAHHSRRLYEAAKEPKALWMLQNVGHIQSTLGSTFRECLVAYMASNLSGNLQETYCQTEPRN